MISIIICGRNDNYGGNFEERLFSTTDYNLEQLRKHNIACELVFVEWNPIRERPLLSQEVAGRYPEARCVVVDELIHHFISENRNIKVFEYHAKNAGARRAKGAWLLFTNPDNFLGDDVLDFLQAGAFKADRYYRADRDDVTGVEDIGKPGLRRVYTQPEPPHLGASGDFFFCAKSAFEAIGGFREDLRFTNTHKDSILCNMMFAHLGKAEMIGTTFHLRHEREGHADRRLDFAFNKVNTGPQPGYGLVDVVEKKLDSSRIVELYLPDNLADEARRKQPVAPVVPEVLRPVRRSKIQRLRRKLSRIFAR